MFVDFLRAAHALGSRWVVAENVVGLLSTNRGSDFQAIVEEVAVLWPAGGAAWRVLDAAMYGVPQRRRRVYLVVNASSPSLAAEALAVTEGCGGNDEEDGRTWEGAARRSGLRLEGYCLASPQANAELTFGGLCPTLTALHEPPIWVHEVDGSTVAERLTPDDYELLQGMPGDHTRIPWHGRPASRCPDGPRYKAIGNSMAVPVMRWIGERIAEDAIERAMRYAHDTGFDEGYEQGYELGYENGYDEGVDSMDPSEGPPPTAANVYEAALLACSVMTNAMIALSSVASAGKRAMARKRYEESFGALAGLHERARGKDGSN